jgi:transposase
MARMGSDKRGRRARRQFSDEFRAGAVRLVLDEGETVGAVARELDLTPSALSQRVRHVQADRTKGRTGLTTEERFELARLRKDNRELRMERDILKSRGLFRQEPSVVFAWIDAEKAEFPITTLCHCLQVSPSGFYASRGRLESAHARTDQRLRVLVRVVRREPPAVR